VSRERHRSRRGELQLKILLSVNAPS
jgi:hypothetical protein